MSFNLNALLQLLAAGLGGTNIKIGGKNIPVGTILAIVEQEKPLIDELFKHKPQVIVPATERPLVDGFPDDKILVPAPRPVPPPAPPVVAHADYTGLRINIAKAQYNQELFPDQYTEKGGANEFGLYRPARQEVYNRRSKIWGNVTPLKGDHAVEHDEGAADGILWGVEWVGIYNGVETVLKADPHVTHDTHNGANRPIQVVEGESVGFGLEAWDFAESFLAQIQVGDNEGEYELYASLPKLGLRSESIKFRVS